MSENSKSIIKQYIDNSKNSIENPSFFLLYGSTNNKKEDYILNLSREILKDYFINDFLHIKDLSSSLWKSHNIKVEQKDDETYKTLFKEYSYKDIWTREINWRLQQSPAWNTKIVLIENIERMTIWAINAFLKTCEEPLKNRIIIATTKNKSQIIDTVLSRAILINFDTNNVTISPEIQSLIDEFVQLEQENKTLQKRHSFLSDIHKKWLTHDLLESLIAHYVSTNEFPKTEKRLKIKEMSLSNLNMDNLLFYALLD